MGAVVEDIAGGGVDWDGAGVGRRVWVLPVGACQLGCFNVRLDGRHSTQRATVVFQTFAVELLNPYRQVEDQFILGRRIGDGSRGIESAVSINRIEAREKHSRLYNIKQCGNVVPPKLRIDVPPAVGAYRGW